MRRLLAVMMCAVGLGAAAQMPDYVPTDGLLGWWPLDNSPANAFSSDLQGSIDPISGSVLVAGQNRFGEASKCIDFSGNVSRITIPDSDVLDLGQANTNSITYALWFRRTSNPPNSNDEVLLTKGAGSSSATRDYRFWHENNPNSIFEGLVEVTGDGGYDCTRHHFGVLSDVDWHHLVVSSSNAGDGELGSKVVWLDGVLFDSCSYEVKGPSNDGPLYLGGEPGYSNFLGLIDDVGVWGRMLSSEEVDVLYNWVPNGGCTDEFACNFNPDAQLDDGSCISSGCTDSYACNFDATAGCDGGNCDYGCCPGPGCCDQGLTWNWELSLCQDLNPADINLDGCVQLGDLLDLLSAYGNCGAEESAWQCGDPLEYQGYEYATVQIGEQCWFAENLRTLNYLNGDDIPHNLSRLTFSSATYGAACIYGDTSPCENGLACCGGNTCNPDVNEELYGYLYNGFAITDVRGLCPQNWHVSSQPDWYEMLEYVDDLSTGGCTGKALSSGDYWIDSWNGTNVVGFNGLPGGWRDGQGYYADAGEQAHFWTSENATSRSYFKWGGSGCGTYQGSSFQDFARSIRCVRDAE